MARIIFLPGNESVLLLESPLPPPEVLESIRSGSWRPPEPYQSLAAPLAFHAVLMGSVVVVSTDQPVVLPEAVTWATGVPLKLSPRLIQVLQGIADGHSDKEIAARLGLAPHTIYKYVCSLRSRLGARSRSQLVARAMLLGLVKMKHKTER